MKKKVLTLLLAAITMSVVHAAPISRQVAENKAKAFFLAKRPGRQPVLALAKSERRKSPGKGRTDTEDYYYVFNNGEGDGFVVMAADDCAEEVLGYADSGSIDLDNIPENLQAWLDGYAEDIARARTALGSPTFVTRTAAKAANAVGQTQTAKRVVEPLLTSKWTQTGPFNLKCFTSSGEQSVAGCVAISLAQVMNYYKWPQNATTAIPAYNITSNGSVVASYDKLPATTFAWDKIKDIYSGKETIDDESAAAVAQLALYCGHAIKMKYNTNSSSASSTECINALGSYFGFKSKGGMVNRSCHNDAEWENLIYNELCHGRPVIYSGRTSTNTGHSFVCDGFDGEGLFHVNWGWAGLSDGYFRLQVLNPSQQGVGGTVSTIGYSMDQSAIIGMCPWEMEENPYLTNEDIGRLQLDKFTLTSGASKVYDYTSTLFKNVKATFYYRSPIDAKYDLGYGLFKDGKMLEMRKITSLTVSSIYTNYYTTALGSIGASLSEGVYQVKCLSRLTGSTEWMVDIDGDKRFLEITIANGKATFVEKVLQPSLAFVSLEQLYGGSSTRRLLRLKVRNTGTMNFNDQLCLTLGGTEYGKENLSLDSGQEGEVDFVVTYPVTTTSLKVTVDDTGEVVYENNAFAIKAKETGTIDISACSLECADNSTMKLFGTTAETVVTLKNNSSLDAVDRVKLMIYYFTDETTSTYTQTYLNEVLEAGEIKTVKLSYRQLSVGQKVWFVVQTSNSSKSFGSRSKPYTVTAAYSEWDGNGTRTAKELGKSVAISSKAAAVSFVGASLTGVTITPNSNPNTLYYIDADASVPSKLSGKNVVKGDWAAANITLSEGYDYWVPLAFGVKGTVSYHRKAAKACDGNNGWQTISLPFAVGKVTAGGTEVALGDGGLWLRKLVGLNGDLLKLEDEHDWQPNMPYLIGTPAGMVGKAMVFSASTVKVLPTESATVRVGDYDFVGVAAKRTFDKAYVLNAAGDAFVLTEKASVEASNACFTARSLANGSLSRLKISETGLLLGDVNGDGLLSVADVMLMSNYIIDGGATGFIERNGDVNGDGYITVADTMLLVSLIVGS